MTGQAHWLTLAVLLVGAVGITALVLAATRLGMHLQALRRTVVCPKRGRDAHTIAVQRTSDGQWVDVVRCDVLVDPDCVTCQKACLDTLNRMAGARA